MNGYIISNNTNKYSENLFSAKSVFDGTITLNKTGGTSLATITYSDEFVYKKGKSIKSFISDNNVLAPVFNSFNLGDALTFVAPKDGNYVFSFNALADTSIVLDIPLDTVEKIVVTKFVNSLPEEIEFLFEILDSANLSNGKWNNLAQSFDLIEGDVVDFSFAHYKRLDLEPTSTLYLDGFKIELNDRFNGIPTPYSFPLIDQDFDVNNLVYVDDISKFPTPIAGVITLENNFTYIMTKSIDLLGNRIVSNNNVVNLYGESSETCFLTSTGLGIGIALITSNTTIKLRDFTIKDVNTALNLDKDTIMALDWEGLNFTNVPNIGLIKDFDNLIFTKGTFFNSKGLVLDGTFGTAGFSNTLFQGDGLAGNIISLPSTAIVTRRFRLDKCAVVTFGSTIGINVDAGATIQSERYILDTVSFSGGGTYISGTDHTSNKALFRFNDGITNTSENSMYYMENNATATDIVTAGAYVKISGTTISGTASRFTNTNNRATYIGSKTRTFEISAIATFTSGSDGDNIAIKIYKNGIALDGTRAVGVTRTVLGVNKADNVKTQDIVELATNDFLEIYVSNLTDNSDVTITDLNVIIK